MKPSKNLLAVSAAALLATGCQTYNSKTEAISQEWRQGNFTNVAKAFTTKAEKSGSVDAIIWRLEQAAALRATSQYKESNDAFAAAEEKINLHDEQPRISVGRETAAMFSNQANLPYEGRDYDRVMLNAYRALNFLQLGEPDSARTELIRAYQRQQDAVENNRKRIVAEQEKLNAKNEDKIAEEGQDDNAESETSTEESSEVAENAEAKKDDPEEMTAKAQADPKFQESVSTNYVHLEQLQPYAEYVNPFVVYLDALYFMTASSADLARATKSFERVRGLIGENRFIDQDLAGIQQISNGGELPPTVYVIFETGRAPVRDQIRIDVPLFFLGSGNVPYAGAAFPTLKVQDDYIPSLTASAGGGSESTITLASMDRIVGQSFKNELPTIIAKTLISTTAKAAAAYAINKAASDQDAMVGLFFKIGTALTQAAMNIADTRTWTTLPKEMQFCRLPRPADGKLALAGPAGFPHAEVTLDSGAINLVYVKSTSATSPLLISQIKLK